MKILPSGQEAKVEHVYVGEAEQARAGAGQSVTVTLQGEFDISRGDMIVAAGKPAEIADQFRATIIWMDQSEMLPGRVIYSEEQKRGASPQHWPSRATGSM